MSGCLDMDQYCHMILPLDGFMASSIINIMLISDETLNFCSVCPAYANTLDR